MKFAQYLEGAQTSEWKKAYIDYKGLKKQITKIREYQLQSPNATAIFEEQTVQEQSVVAPSNQSVRGARYGSTDRTPPLRTVGLENPSILSLPPRMEEYSGQPPNDGAISFMSQRKPVTKSWSDSVVARVPSHSEAPENIDTRSRADQAPELNTISSAIAESSGARLQRFMRTISRGRATRRSSKYSQNSHIFTSLASLYTVLTPAEMKFFEKLDKELEKADSFFSEREKEAQIRLSLLKEQLRELKDHREIFHEAQQHYSWSLTRTLEVIGFRNPSSKNRNYDISTSRDRHSMNPDDYQQAKQKLRKAVLEYYRGLELLKNYRILNMTGFRKALKKFDKTARISSQDLYFREMVEPKSIASEERLEQMIKDVEDLYTNRFASGDRKRALQKLRATYRIHSHHASTFRSGVLLGLALPALGSGIYQVSLTSTKELLPEWAALLQIYATFLIPVLFALVIGFNLQAWRLNRINWIFIFELEMRSAIDTREYFELPAFLLSTLVYTFYLTFTMYTSKFLHPKYLPLVWVGVVILVMVNPFSTFHKRSRYWLIKEIKNLFWSVSMLERIEFTDFWMGDQFCSLVYTFSNLYFVGCSYKSAFNDPWVECSANASSWSIYFLLASMPSFIRLVQSVKRYIDSGLYTHLINAGKYGSSIVGLACYWRWRRFGSTTAWLVPYIIFSSVMSLYTTAWDLLMDWSFFQRNSKHPLLRSSLIYTTWTPIYYFAIISNVALRFIWILYVVKPQSGPSSSVRSFVAAILEMLRRLQWNFYRLENEHIGNTDQYRVTREVPLPYRLEEEEDGSGDEREDKAIRLPNLDHDARIPGVSA